MINDILDIFFPRYVTCIYCNNELTDKTKYSLCDSCLSTLPFIRGNTCKLCGTEIGYGEICLECEKEKYYFNKGLSILEYNQDSKKLILNFKYNKKTYIGYYFAEMIYDRLKLEEDFKFDYITFVPSFKKKKKMRGFNQSEIIAKYLSKFTNIPYGKVVKKIKNTKEMKKLDKKHRKKALKNSFKAIDSNVNFKNCLLIDDIFTTGTTLNECAKVIYEKFLCDICVITLYNGRKDRIGE